MAPPPRRYRRSRSRERDLPDEAIASLGPRERGFDEPRQRTPQRQLVAHCLRELERGGNGGGRAPAANARGRPTSRQAPGAPAVRPQTFGDGATREPGKLPQLANSECFELLVTPALEREERERQRCEELRQLLVGDHDHLPGSRDGSCRERGEAACGRAYTRVPLGSDRRERASERRLEAAVEPLDSPRLEVRDAERGRLDSEAGIF